MVVVGMAHAKQIDKRLIQKRVNRMGRVIENKFPLSGQCLKRGSTSLHMGLGASLVPGVCKSGGIIPVIEAGFECAFYRQVKTSLEKLLANKEYNREDF
jgi:hypothetical protein